MTNQESQAGSLDEIEAKFGVLIERIFVDNDGSQLHLVTSSQQDITHLAILADQLSQKLSSEDLFKRAENGEIEQSDVEEQLNLWRTIAAVTNATYVFANVLMEAVCARVHHLRNPNDDENITMTVRSFCKEYRHELDPSAAIKGWVIAIYRHKVVSHHENIRRRVLKRDGNGKVTTQLVGPNIGLDSTQVEKIQSVAKLAQLEVANGYECLDTLFLIVPLFSDDGKESDIRRSVDALVDEVGVSSLSALEVVDFTLDFLFAAVGLVAEKSATGQIEPDLQ